MFLHHIALVDQSRQLHAADLSQAAAALQKQATRDLSPIWGVRATVDYFPSLKNVPVGYWPIIIAKNIHTNAEGYHDDKHHQPFALVKLEDGWPLTCSHEMCEMLVDPFGNRMMASNSIKPGQGRVKYLVEVCDPSEAASFGYSVNGVLLSDFYTPHYFDPVVSPSTRYSFTGAIKRPREVKKGGYLSWYDAQSKQWWQANYFDRAVKIVQLKGMQDSGASLRSQLDRLTKYPDHKKILKSAYASNKKNIQHNLRSSDAEGGHWEETIKQHLNRKKK